MVPYVVVIMITWPYDRWYFRNGTRWRHSSSGRL